MICSSSDETAMKLMTNRFKRNETHFLSLIFSFSIEIFFMIVNFTIYLFFWYIFKFKLSWFCYVQFFNYFRTNSFFVEFFFVFNFVHVSLLFHYFLLTWNLRSSWWANKWHKKYKILHQVDSVQVYKHFIGLFLNYLFQICS